MLGDSMDCTEVDKFQSESTIYIAVTATSI